MERLTEEQVAQAIWGRKVKRTGYEARLCKAYTNRLNDALASKDEGECPNPDVCGCKSTIGKKKGEQ